MQDQMDVGDPSPRNRIETASLVGIRQRAVDGAAATLGGRFALTAIQFVSTIVLARLLTPQDFGLVGMVAPIAVLISVFRDAGLSTATLQAKDITHEQVSGLFWVNIVLGALLAAGLAASAPMLAAFYGREDIYAMTLVYSGSLFVSSLSVQHEALLRRQMAFGRLALINIAATFVSAALAAILAWRGWGYWALVAMAYANALVILVAVWYAIPWRPGPLKRKVGLRKVVHFGTYVAGGNFLYLLSENVAPIVLGRTAGAVDVGLYGRVSRLKEQIVDQVRAPLMQLIMPTLSRLQEDDARLKRAVQHILEKGTALTFALAGLLVVTGQDLVLVLFGEQWSAAGLVVQLLAIGALAAPISSILAATMISLGFSRPMFLWSAWSLLIRLTAVGVGAAWGLIGIAAAIAGSQWLGLMLFSIFVGRYAPVRPTDLIRSSGPAAFAAASAITVGMLVAPVLNQGTATMSVALMGALFSVVYLLALAATINGRRVIRESWQIGRETIFRGIAGRKSSSPTPADIQ